MLCISYAMAYEQVDRMIQETVDAASRMTAEDFLTSKVYYSPKEYHRLLDMLKYVEENLLFTVNFAGQFDREEIQCRKVILLNHLVLVKSELEFYDMHLLHTKMNYEDLYIRRQAVQMYHRLRELHQHLEVLLYEE